MQSIRIRVCVCVSTKLSKTQCEFYGQHHKIIISRFVFEFYDQQNKIRQLFFIRDYYTLESVGTHQYKRISVIGMDNGSM